MAPKMQTHQFTAYAPVATSSRAKSIRTFDLYDKLPSAIECIPFAG